MSCLIRIYSFFEFRAQLFETKDAYAKAPYNFSAKHIYTQLIFLSTVGLNKSLTNSFVKLTML